LKTKRADPLRAHNERNRRMVADRLDQKPAEAAQPLQSGGRRTRRAVKPEIRPEHPILRHAGRSQAGLERRTFVAKPPHAGRGNRQRVIRPSLALARGIAVASRLVRPALWHAGVATLLARAARWRPDSALVVLAATRAGRGRGTGRRRMIRRCASAGPRADQCAAAWRPGQALQGQSDRRQAGRARAENPRRSPARHANHPQRLRWCSFESYVRCRRGTIPSRKPRIRAAKRPGILAGSPHRPPAIWHHPLVVLLLASRLPGPFTSPIAENKVPFRG